MQLFGLEVRRVRKAAVGSTRVFEPVSTGRGGWWPIVFEPHTGDWQRNQSRLGDDVAAHPIVFACVTRIAQDIAKLWVKLLRYDEEGIGTEATSSPYQAVLTKPNRFSTRIKFFEYWMLSKLLRGNTYALKAREPQRGLVNALYILDPTTVQVLVAPDGSVFYHLTADSLSGVPGDGLTVPAREILHDIAVPLYHPLIGVSPLYAAAASAWQGLQIAKQSDHFFGRGANPSGILSGPNPMTAEQAERIERFWAENYMGPDNAGKVIAIGDGLKYEQITMSAVDAQLIEQLKWTDEQIPRVYGIPPYMVGLGPAPPYTDIQSLNLQYYTQALQNPIENLEELLRIGLELPSDLEVEFDEDALLRMDTKTQIDNATKAIGGGLSKPNEERKKRNLPPVPGGDSVYLQQQQYSLEALAKRDAAPPTEPPTSIPSPDSVDAGDAGAPPPVPKSLSKTLEREATLRFREMMDELSVDDALRI